MRRYLFVIVFVFTLNVVLQSQINKLFISKARNPIYGFVESHHWLITPPADTINGQWSYINSMPQALFGVNSYYLPSINKIFLCGGADSNAINKRACYLYNLSTNMYEPADSMPSGRVCGKLVMVMDSLYLIGSIGADFNFPDGAIYKFDYHLNKWQVKTPMPSPLLEESAVCVWHDSIIVTIGGSMSGFGSPTNIIRTYSPASDLWHTSTSAFYQQTTCSAAECNGNVILVVGGWGGVYYNDVIKGGDDTLSSIDNITWERVGNSPYPSGVYRVASGQYWGNLLFGPALDNFRNYGQLWAFNLMDTTWRRFLPNALDSVGNIPTLSIYPAADSIYCYIFGGSNNQINILNKAERFSFQNQQIGIHGISNTIPETYKLFQNYPNPFNPTTVIKYEIPSSVKSAMSNVKLIVFDVLGREVATLVDERQSSGTYQAVFNGFQLSSGIYIYRLSATGGAGDYFEAKKMILIK